MSYQLLNSGAVQVFPFGKKRHHDSNARVLNEQNITNLVRMLTDRKSYVVSFDEENKVIEFVINGYLFKTDVSELWELFTQNKAVYAAIDLATTDDNYSYLKGGDNVSVILTGTGTSKETPYELSDGTFTTVIRRPEGDITDQDTYFQYTFSIKGTLTIYDNEKIKISNLAEGSYTQEENKIIVSGEPGSVVNFCIGLESTATSGNICIDCPNAGKFTGIRFVFDDPQEGFYLKLFEVTDSVINVPVDSFLKFEQSSIGSSIESVDFINCGTAAEFIEE